MEQLLSGDLEGITMEDVHYNGFSQQSEDTQALEGQIRVACVGDSITYGHGIYNWPEKNYPKVLGTLLGSQYHVQNFGVCGRCVQDSSDQPYRADARYQKSLEYDADILVFMMGTNDSKPENWYGEAAFRQSLLQLLDSYLEGKKHPQIYLCIPATAFFAEGFSETVTKFDVQPKIVDQIAQIIRQIGTDRGYQLIDIHTITGSHPEWFTADSVHPDNDGAAAIAQAVYSVLTNRSS